MNYRLALCIPKSSFNSPIQGEPYITAVPEEMKHFDKRCDFVRWLGAESIYFFNAPQLTTEDFLNLSSNTKRIALLPKAY